MMLKISKCYYSYSFHLISPKLYEHIGDYSEMQVITFLGNLPSFTYFVTL